MFLQVFKNLGKSEKQRKLWPIFLKNLSEKKKKEIFFFYRFASALFFKDMIRIVKGFALWIFI